MEWVNAFRSIAKMTRYLANRKRAKFERECQPVGLE